VASRILIAEDDPTSARFLSLALAHLGHEVRHAKDGAEALLALEEFPADLILTDLQMPCMGGIELLGRVRERWPGLPVIVITVVEEVETIVSAVQRGAINYLLKPCSAERIGDAVAKALRRPPSLPRGGGPLAAIIGGSRAILEARRAIELAAQCDVPVLITGRTGTGKELAARAIHADSSLASGPFIAHNGATTTRELFDSVLFGHVRGAFTGADRDSEGLLQAAHGGVLFLDELEALLPELQAKLLRVLDDGEARPVGSPKSYHVSVRFLAATNRDPGEMLREGSLRDDLYYRLRGIEIRMPTLAERLEDLPLLVDHFLGEQHPGCTREGMAALRSHPWPGNVRELRYVLQAAKARAPERALEPGDLALPTTTAITGVGDRCGTLRDAELEVIQRTLRAFGGNLSGTAKALGIDRSTLRRKLAERS
jgi:DNA-binding NtrC family response regulator